MKTRTKGFIQILVTVVLAAITTFGSAFYIYNYLPLDYLESNQEPRPLGSTITVINGSDRLTDSRAVINTNFANLNADKLERSDFFASTTMGQITNLPNLTSAALLATIGTITTGVWNGTPIPVAYGGTGTTSPTTNQVILGNGASGFKVVSGFGSSGQLLMSNGVNTAPTWESPSVDTTIDYNWTGTNRFKNLHASSTSANPIVLNGVSWNTPSTQGSAGTVLSNDGSGNLTWSTPSSGLSLSKTIAMNTYVNTFYNNTSSTTIATIKIPANSLSATNGWIRISTDWSNSLGGGNHCGGINLGDGSSTSTVMWMCNYGANTFSITDIVATGTSAQYVTTNFNNQGQANGQQGYGNRPVSGDIYIAWTGMGDGGIAHTGIMKYLVELMTR